MMRKKAKKAQMGALLKLGKKAARAAKTNKARKVVKKNKLPVSDKTLESFLKETPKSKSGTKMKKATYGKTMKAKSGTKTKMKKAPAGSKGNGMRSLPKAVRNKIGFAKKGKTVKKAGYGTKAKKAKMGCSTRRKKK